MKKYTFVATGFALVALTLAQQGCYEDAINNWYCNQVSAITYTGFGAAGTYEQVTNMQNEQCSFTPFSYHGGMAPLDAEVSWHFRGPMHLKQFAFYTPGSSSNKMAKRESSVRPSSHERRLAQGNARDSLVKRAAEVSKPDEIMERGVGDVVTATMNGQVVTWINNYSGGGSAAGATPAPLPVSSASSIASSAAAAAPTTNSGSSSSPAILNSNAGAGKWGRQAYYSAGQGTAEGLVFLNNKGGSGSGVFDTTWGNSLSYASADGQSASSGPQTLNNVLLEDGDELVVMTSTPCSGSNCAGAIRPGAVAYEGFNGPSKLFLLEFDMPLTGKRGANMDMPAAWILNAQIPRTGQYSSCSCWKSGCGEWDIFEVLDPGNTKCKSTFHGAPGQSGGASQWFQRPTGQTVKVAVLFDGTSARGTGSIFVLPNDTTFDNVLADSQIQNFLKTVTGATTTFALPG